MPSIKNYIAYKAGEKYLIRSRTFVRRPKVILAIIDPSQCLKLHQV